MTGKVLKVASNDLYGNVDDRVVSVYACFEHTKYMNNYVVFSIDNDIKNLCYGSIHLKNKSIVVFSVKENVRKYIDGFLSEYMSDSVNNFKILDITNMEKIELVSYNKMEYNNIQLLDNKAIPKVILEDDSVNKKKKSPILLYLILFILILLGIGLTILYLKPELFTVKHKGLKCENNLYDNKLELYYGIEKDIKFDKDNKVNNIYVIRTYTFLDSNSYYDFKNNEMHNKYFTNGEGYKYVDNQLQFKLLYDENSVIDDYNEMLTYLKREGFSCAGYEYEK